MTSPALSDPAAAHQLNLHWTANCTAIVPSCNCGHHWPPFRPERGGAVEGVLASYHSHMQAVAA